MRNALHTCPHANGDRTHNIFLFIYFAAFLILVRNALQTCLRANGDRTHISSQTTTHSDSQRKVRHDFQQSHTNHPHIQQTTHFSPVRIKIPACSHAQCDGTHNDSPVRFFSLCFLFFSLPRPRPGFGPFFFFFFFFSQSYGETGEGSVSPSSLTRGAGSSWRGVG